MPSTHQITTENRLGSRPHTWGAAWAIGSQCLLPRSPQSHVCVVSSFVSNSATPWTVHHSLLCPWDSPGKNTGVGSLSLLQGIFLTQRSNLD